MPLTFCTQKCYCKHSPFWAMNTGQCVRNFHGQPNHAGNGLPDLQARRRKAKAKERAALDPTLAKPSTPLLTGRALRKQTKTFRPIVFTASIRSSLKCNPVSFKALFFLPFVIDGRERRAGGTLPAHFVLFLHHTVGE